MSCLVRPDSRQPITAAQGIVPHPGAWRDRVIHMRTLWFAAALAISVNPALRSEIHDVLKNAEIADGLAKVKGSLTVHQRPNFSISLHAQEGGTSAPETHDAADEVLFIRRGSGLLWLENRRYE